MTERAVTSASPAEGVRTGLVATDARLQSALEDAPGDRDGVRMASHLLELGRAARALGWMCRQAHDAGVTQPVPAITPELMAPELDPAQRRHQRPVAWQRFDVAWQRLCARQGSMLAVSGALLEFARACELTAAQLSPR